MQANPTPDFDGTQTTALFAMNEEESTMAVVPATTSLSSSSLADSHAIRTCLSSQQSQIVAQQRGQAIMNESSQYFDYSDAQVKRVNDIHLSLYQDLGRFEQETASVKFALKEKERALQDYSRRSDSQKKSIGDLQFKCEYLTSALANEKINQEEMKRKIKASREMCLALNAQADRIMDSLRRSENDRDEMRLQQECYTKKYEDLTEKVLQLEEAHAKKVLDLATSYDRDMSRCSKKEDELNLAIEAMKNEALERDADNRRLVDKCAQNELDVESLKTSKETLDALLTASRKEFESDKAELSKEVECYRKSDARLSEQISLLQRELETVASEKAAQEAEYVEKEMKNRGEIEKMQQVVKSAEENMRQTREAAASLEQARALLQNQLNETVAEKESLLRTQEEKSKEFQTCKANLESQLDCTANELAISTNRLSELEKVKAELETEKGYLQVDFEELMEQCEKYREQNEEMTAKLSTCNEEIKSKTIQIQELKSEVDETRRQKEEALTDFDVLRKKCKNKEEALDKAKADHRKSVEAMQQSKEKVQDDMEMNELQWKTALDECKAERERRLQESSKAHEKELAELERQVEAEKKKAENALVKKEELEQKVAELSKRLKDSDTKTKANKAEERARERKTKQEFKSAEKRMSALEKDLERKTSALEKISKEKSLLQEENQSFKQREEKLAEEKSSLNEDIRILEDEKKDLQSTTATLRGEVNSLKAANTKQEKASEEKLQKGDAENRKLKALIAEKDEKIFALDCRRKEQVADQESKQNKLEADIEQYENRLAQSESELKALRGIKKELEKIQAKELFDSKNRQDLEEDVKRLEMELNVVRKELKNELLAKKTMAEELHDKECEVKRLKQLVPATPPAGVVPLTSKASRAPRRAVTGVSTSRSSRDAVTETSTPRRANAAQASPLQGPSSPSPPPPPPLPPPPETSRARRGILKLAGQDSAPRGARSSRKAVVFKEAEKRKSERSSKRGRLQHDMPLSPLRQTKKVCTDETDVFNRLFAESDASFFGTNPPTTSAQSKLRPKRKTLSADWYDTDPVYRFDDDGSDK